MGKFLAGLTVVVGGWFLSYGGAVIILQPQDLVGFIFGLTLITVGPMASLAIVQS